MEHITYTTPVLVEGTVSVKRSIALIGVHEAAQVVFTGTRYYVTGLYQSQGTTDKWTRDRNELAALVREYETKMLRNPRDCKPGVCDHD